MSIGSARTATSRTASSSPPTAKVIAPRRREPVLRTSISCSA